MRKRARNALSLLGFAATVAVIVRAWRLDWGFGLALLVIMLAAAGERALRAPGRDPERAEPTEAEVRRALAIAAQVRADARREYAAFQEGIRGQ